MNRMSRRHFVQSSLAWCGAAAAAGALGPAAARAAKRGDRMRLGLVTYLWGRDWDLPTLLANCEKTGMEGVELRTEHAHGVEPELSARERREVKRRFADSPVVYVGLGTNQCYDYPDPQRLAESIERTKAFIKLSYDTGGLGVKVKPNSFHEGVDRNQTIRQIGESLNVVGKFAADYNQKIRLEVHGSCSPLPVIKQIMDHVDQPNVGVCWNCNAQDLEGEGLEHNFKLVCDRFGDTAHVRELNVGGYPYPELMRLFVEIDYAGWILLECRTNPPDRIKALIEQRKVFRRLVAEAQAALG